MDDRESALHTRPSLLVQIRDPEDAAAWRTFVAIYSPLVFRYCRRNRLQDSDASDVVQEVMAQVARSIRGFTYQPEKGRFRDWLGVVTRTKMWEHIRFRDRAARGSGGDEHDELLAHLASPEADTAWTVEFQAGILRVALERVRPCFEPATWRVFERIWLEDHPASEVGCDAGMTIDAVYVAKSRVLKRLREEVIALAEDLPLVATAQ